MSDAAPRWHAAIGYALVGEDLALDEPVQPDPARLVTDLADAGWDLSWAKLVRTLSVESGEDRSFVVG